MENKHFLLAQPLSASPWTAWSITPLQHDDATYILHSRAGVLPHFSSKGNNGGNYFL